MADDIEISSESLSRRDERALVFHVLYVMESFDYDIPFEGLLENFKRGFSIEIPLDSEVAKISRAIIENRAELDEAIKPYLANWRFERISVTTKLILRLAVWELKLGSTAPTIIINEAIELAKCFAETDAYRFVNGILDAMAKEKAATE